VLLGQIAILVRAAVGGAVGYLIAGVAAADIAGVIFATLEGVPIVLAHLSMAALVGNLSHRKGPAVGALMGLVVGG
jgi:hypothetical protein